MIKNIIKFFNKISNYNYINNIKTSFKKLNKSTIKIIKLGLKCCFTISILSILILTIYNYYITAPILFNIGYILMKLSLTFGVEFIICGFVVDNIKEGII